MVPLRVFVQGFLSYREGVDLAFGGASLWVLTGRNGAGKSAIFDAITFALYGYHRGGGSSYTDLINHSCDDLIVEFDFLLDADEYRVRRTVSRRGQSTRHIFHISGPSAPNPATIKSQMVPDTDSDRGFRQWITDNIGLDYKTFTSSVVLKQGESDKLLKAKPAERHEMLSEIIDLSAYERLCNRSKERYDAYRGDANHCKKQIDTIPSIDEKQINDVEACIGDLVGRKGNTQNEISGLLTLKTHAKRWETLQQQQLDLLGKLRGEQVLLDSADEIERNYNRYLELDNVLPKLVPWHEARTKIVALEGQIERDSGRLKEFRKQLSQDDSNLTKASSSVQETQVQFQDISEQLNKTQDKLTALQPKVGQLTRRKQLQEVISGLDNQLTKYPSSLDEDIGEHQVTIKRLNELAVAIPWLEQFINARSEWQSANKSVSDLERERAEIKTEIERAEQQFAHDTSALEVLIQQYNEIQQLVVRETTLFKEALSSLNRFQEVEDASNCHYCGQPLTSKHKEAEQQRLTSLLAEHEAALEHVKSRQEKIDIQKNATSIASQKADNERKRLDARLNSVQGNLDGALQTARSQERNGQAAFENLPLPIGSQIHAEKDSVIMWSEYPSVSDIRTYQKEVANLDRLKRRLDRLEETQREHESLLSKRRYNVEEFDSIDSRFTKEEITELREEYRATDGLRKKLNGQRIVLKERLDIERGVFISAESKRDQTRQVLNKVEQDITAIKTKHQHLDGQVGAYEDQIPESWRSCLIDLSSPQLQQWLEEHDTLKPSKQQFSNLIEARKKSAQYQVTLEIVKKDLAKVPDEARCSPVSISDDISKKQKSLENIEELLGHQQIAKARLVDQQERRTKLEQELVDLVRKTHLYKELTSLLGRENLQRHLLQQVEASIVENANEVLDHISSGELFLELRGQATANEDASSKKALDIIAYNRRTGSTPMSVAYLSGSQKFRVAVSLALGIGRFVSRDSKRIESVIIDEGFGGLDHDGRRDMISELHLLKDTLSRIILVSHQEEFAHAFENGYEIKLIEGVSSAELMNHRYQN